MRDPVALVDRAGGLAIAARMREERAAERRRRATVVWGGLLLAAICFEGLGRKYVSSVPQPIFYLAKDVVLLAGLAVFGVDARVLGAARALLRGFVAVLALGFAWTVIQIANPQAPSLALGLLGLRAYWLWWIAPLVVATALKSKAARDAIAPILGAVAFAVAAYAAYQFASPAGSEVTQYAGYEGWVDPATVATTGRARVSSTFSYMSGFVAFALMAPPVLMWLGLEATSLRVRVAAFAGASATLLASPMTGSRGAAIMAAIAIGVVVWRAGLLATRAGRRIAGLVAASLVAMEWLAPEAIQGVRDRFDIDDTSQRILEIATGVTPLPMLQYDDYPLLGLGTGSQHNAATIIGATSQWQIEGEPGRYLVELGAPGFVLMYLRRVGLAVALLRVATRLRRAGRLPASGVALWLAVGSMAGNLVFDHVFQALFFLGVGLLLAETVYGQEAATPIG